MIVKDWLKANRRELSHEYNFAVSVYNDYTVEQKPLFETNMSWEALEQLFGNYGMMRLDATGSLLWLFISRVWSNPQKEEST